ncbi:MAG: riboflavin synthase [Gammaproteobacteria bacterium]|nr:riboflavin synthase [Gammaproteobacteria bacterium]
MFNGIVECIGVIENIDEINCCKTFTIRPHSKLSDIKINDSISVNGVCLTLTDDREYLEFTAIPETLKMTNLDKLKIGSLVNLERSLKMNARISGHYVQGHVDCMGEIIAISHEGDALNVKMTIPHAMRNYIVYKGYITIDGMSITVVRCEKDNFSIALIPHTQALTIAKNYSLNTWVNIETDILGRYIEKFLEARTK